MMNISEIDTVALNEEKCVVDIIDQTLLPNEIKIISLSEKGPMFDAIKLLQVRGAPAIGVFAAMAMYVLAERSSEQTLAGFNSEFASNREYLNSSRPTAVNLSWALKKMQNVVDTTENSFDAEYNDSEMIKKVVEALHDEAVKIRDDDIDTCRKIGEYGASLIHDGDGILTHCNAGKLATVRYGTATAPMYLAYEKGLDIKVYCDETRPLLQGARLTSFELSAAGIDTTLNCDNMSSSLMKAGKINIIFVGCDRVAANGDTANKIGTSLLAIAAKYYGVPFYVCAPYSTIDKATATGADIPIEMRDPDEVAEMWYEKRMAPTGIHIYNPAFDVTDHKLITGFVTERGILRPDEL